MTALFRAVWGLVLHLSVSLSVSDIITQNNTQWRHPSGNDAQHTAIMSPL